MGNIALFLWVYAVSIDCESGNIDMKPITAGTTKVISEQGMHICRAQSCMLVDTVRWLEMKELLKHKVIRSTEAECDIAGVFCINNFLT
jgi:hypothetical protein